VTDQIERDELTDAEKAEALADRERRVRAEKTRLRRMLTKGGVDTERLRGCDRLMQRAAFLAVTLEDLEAKINRNGTTDRYQNGEAQWGVKQSPDVQTHATFTQRYLTAMKQLVDLLPDSASAPKGDALLDHINRR
jgi:hypothetical protein